MLLKRMFIFCVMVFYLYTLAYGIFMTNSLRIPAPIIFNFILFLFMPGKMKKYEYYTEMLFFTSALFLFYVVGAGDFKAFMAVFITILTCSFYFNFFVGADRRRFNISVILFVALLAFSMVIMVLDHPYQSIIDPVRGLLLNEQIEQSPAGLSVTQFTFGYQIASFTAFAFVAAFTFRQHLLIKVSVMCLCMICIYLGMNRSAFVSFCAAAVVFLFVYYRYKALVFILAAAIICFGVYTLVIKGNMDEKNNILSKNQAKEANDFNRANLAAENLKIYANYPFGLIFYGKNWDDVTYRNSLFTFGLSSHNAYLMFITYLGPFLGLGILGALYYKIVMLFWQTIKNARHKTAALYLALFFSFLAVSLNALSHNGWLLSVDGPTIFLYFAILKYNKLPPLLPRSNQTGHILKQQKTYEVPDHEEKDLSVC